MTAWLLSGLGAKKKSGGVPTETDIFPELNSVGGSDGGQESFEGDRVLATFQAMALQEQMRGLHADNR